MHDDIPGVGLWVTVFADMCQEDEDGWWNGRCGNSFGVLPVTYVEAVTSTAVLFKARGLYDFTVSVVTCLCL
jgi:hypothetical protein